MSDGGSLVSELIKDMEPSPSGLTAQPQIAGSRMSQESNGAEEMHKTTGEEEDEEEKEEDKLKEEEDHKEEEDNEDYEEEEEKEEEVTRSALLEPSTLPWSEDKKLKTNNAHGLCSENRVPVPDETDAGLYRGNQVMSEEQSQAESDRKSKAQWRDSLPEGERCRDNEIELQQGHARDNSVADEEEEQKVDMNWLSEKAALGFIPQVTIVRPSSKEPLEESQHFIEKDIEREVQMEPDSAAQFYSEWTEQDDKYCECFHKLDVTEQCGCLGSLSLSLSDPLKYLKIISVGIWSYINKV